VSESNPLAFLEHGRTLPEKREAEQRTTDFTDIYHAADDNSLSEQASRCLDCGNPYCQWQCPLHNHIPNWLELVQAGKFKQAARTMVATNPLPEICGRVCPQDRLCEMACTLNTGFGAVTIGNIEKQISDMAMENDWYDTPIAINQTDYKVAVIGAGPAGIGCADYLSRHGAAVTVFEKYPQIGGLLTFGIPGFKLEKEVVFKRQKVLESQGIEFRTSTEVGKDISFDELQQNYDAIFLGIGAYRAVDGGLMDTSNPNIIPALDYLIGVTNENLQLGMPEATFHDLKGKHVMVFGGGDTAMDCVRTATRQGAASVKCVYRRTEAEMPGSRKEVKSAKEEGVEFVFQVQPLAINKDGEQLAIDIERRDTSEQETLSADVAIIAFGFRPNPPEWLTATGVELEADQRIKTVASKLNPEWQQGTNVAKIYVGGDMSRGADLVVTAIADGRNAAQQILTDLEQAKLES
jgi:glutamate synthase (NADPH/NADH) small chain